MPRGTGGYNRLSTVPGAGRRRDRPVTDPSSLQSVQHLTPELVEVVQLRRHGVDDDRVVDAAVLVHEDVTDCTRRSRTPPRSATGARTRDASRYRGSPREHAGRSNAALSGSLRARRACRGCVHDPARATSARYPWQMGLKLSNARAVRRASSYSASSSRTNRNADGPRPPAPADPRGDGAMRRPGVASVAGSAAARACEAGSTAASPRPARRRGSTRGPLPGRPRDAA